ncbi:VOC family protein [Flavobacterium sp. XGLA_31]|uniref:VOC family protein n=1 Tax=Flavobacterium sp. XGLA_31 TaxID=3447666 RepID=UPI003F35B14D
MKTNRQPGINHIEFWVSDLNKSFAFYKAFLEIIEWNPIGNYAMATSTMEIYFKEMVGLKTIPVLGVRHICFQATRKEQVDKIGLLLHTMNAKIIRGPVEMPYSNGYYTVDFYDPDGFIIEVAYTPHAVFAV